MNRNEQEAKGLSVLHRRGKDQLAIIGMSCRIGDCEHYQNLKMEMPEVKELTQSDYFDHEFYGLRVADARLLEARERLLLEEIWHCIEDAGLTLTHLAAQRTQLYLALKAAPVENDPYGLGIQMAMPMGRDFDMANRISGMLGLAPQGLVIEMENGSSLAALNKASDDLDNGVCDVAIVAAVDLENIQSVTAVMMCQSDHALAADCYIHGYVIGSSTTLETAPVPDFQKALAGRDFHLEPVLSSDVFPGEASSGLLALIHQLKPDSERQCVVHTGLYYRSEGGLCSTIIVKADAFKNQSQEITGDHFITLSARSPEALKAQVDGLRTFLEKQPFGNLNLLDLCATLATGREHFTWRRGTMVGSLSDLKNFLMHCNEGQDQAEWRPRGLWLGDFLLHGFEEIRELWEHQTLFRGHCSRLLTVLEKEEPVFASMFQQGSWPQSAQPALSGLCLMAVVESLQDLGYEPDTVSGEGLGFLVALGITQMLSPGDCFKAILGHYQLKLGRPNYSLVDPLSGKVLRPFRFTQEYLEALISKAIPNETNLSWFAQRAILVLSDREARSVLRDWNRELKPFGLNMRQLSNGWDQLDEPLRLIMVCGLVHAMSELPRNQAMDALGALGSEALRELVDLLIDGVCTPQILVAYLLADTPMGDSLDKRVSHLNQGHSYTLLRKYNAVMNDVEDTSAWLSERSAVKLQQPLPMPMSWLVFARGENSPNADLCLDWEANSFNQLVMELWSSGVQIKWSCIYKDGEFTRQPLPSYPFRKRPMWLSDALSKPFTARKATKKPLELTRDFKERAVDTIRNLIAEVLELGANEVSVTEPFSNVIGANRLAYRKISMRLTQIFGPLSATILFEHSSVEDLAVYFRNNYEKGIHSLQKSKTSESPQSTGESQIMGKVIAFAPRS